MGTRPRWKLACALLLLLVSVPVARTGRFGDTAEESDAAVVITPLRTRPQAAPAPQSARVIWILWFEGWRRAPWLVQSVARSWELHNPGWTVVRLSADNLAQYVSAPYLDDMAKLEERTARGWKKPLRRWLRPAQSDVVRLHLLSTHGGVWSDATLLCNQPLDEWVYAAVGKTGFFAYTAGGEAHPLPADYMDYDTAHGQIQQVGGMGASSGAQSWMPPPATLGRDESVNSSEVALRVGRVRHHGIGQHACSWFLVSTKHARLMTRWRNAVDEYWTKRLEGKVASKGYFWMDDIFIELFASDAQFASDWDTVPRINCDDPGQAHMFGFTSHLRLTAADRAILEHSPPHVLKLSRHRLPDSSTWLAQLLRPREWRRVLLRTTAAYKAVIISLARGEAAVAAQRKAAGSQPPGSASANAPPTVPLDDALDEGYLPGGSLLLRNCKGVTPAKARAAVLRWRMEHNKGYAPSNRTAAMVPVLVRDACTFCAAVPGLPLAKCVPVPPWTTQ